LNKIFKAIEESDKIVIMRHVSPDLDALGSQFGLKRAIEVKFPEKTVLAVGEKSEGLSWLGELDEIDDTTFDDALIVALDTANLDRLSLYKEETTRNRKLLAKIDHHPDNEPFGDLSYVDTNASSVSEIIAQFIFDYLEMDASSASSLYAGIVGDTGRFLFNSVTEHTFEIAARLKSYGVETFEINQRISEIDIKIAKFYGYIYDNLDIDETGVSHVVVTQEAMAQFGISYEETNAIMGIFGTIKQIKTWAVFIEKSEKQGGGFRARIRSKRIAINQVAMRHSGGGHPFASGANAKDLEEINEIVEELKIVVKEG
jgi:phosphoesterase RecJ-like protein